MTDLIKSARELAEAATTSPWIADTKANVGDNWLIGAVIDCGNSGVDGSDWIVTTNHVRTSELSGDAKDDADFIAWCRTGVPALCDEVERLRTALEKAETDLSIAVEMVASLEEATGEILDEEDGAIMDQIARDQFARRMAAASKSEES